MGGTASILAGSCGSSHASDEALKKSMLHGTPVASLLSPDDLIVFASIFTITELQPDTILILSSGEFFVVGDGEVQVFVVNPGIDTHTGDNRVVLCTKRKGDIIYVPAVNRLVSELEHQRRRSSGTGKHKQLYKMIDNTSIKSFNGATLLKLDKVKYQRFVRDRNHYLDLATLHKVMESNIVDYLHQIKFLSQVPPGKLNVLSSMCNYEFKSAGEEVCREGELGAEVFLVIDGKLSVETVKNGQVLKLAELTPGQNFGELGALLRVRRIATVRAMEQAMLVSIKRHDFRSFLSINPELQAGVEAEVKFYLLRKFSTMGHPLFPEHRLLSPDCPAGPDLSPLSSFCEVLDVEGSTAVFCEGQPTQGLFLLVEGCVQVTFNDPTLPPNTIYDGEIFGNCAVLDGDTPERYTVVTQKPSVFLKIPRFDFFRYLHANPDINAALELRNARRSLSLHRLLLIPAGKAAFYQHLLSEFSLENLEFYDEVEQLEQLTSMNEVIEKAQELSSLYVVQGASKQVNISDSQRTRINRAMDSRLSGAGIKESFGDAKREILLLMQKDNYTRFKDKPIFQTLLHAVDSAIPSAAPRLCPDLQLAGSSMLRPSMAQTVPMRGLKHTSMTTIDMAMMSRGA